MEIDPVIVGAVVVQFEEGDNDEEYIQEARRPNQSRMILKDLLRQQRNNAADKQGGRRPASAVVTLVGSLSVDGLQVHTSYRQQSTSS